MLIVVIHCLTAINLQQQLVLLIIYCLEVINELYNLVNAYYMLWIAFCTNLVNTYYMFWIVFCLVQVFATAIGFIDYLLSRGN
jgi:hypothetical protein